MQGLVLNSLAEQASSRWLECCGFKLVSLLFGNHFVVELLWPCRERRARRIVTVESESSQYFINERNIRIRGGGAPQFLYGICFVAMPGVSRILRFLNLLFNIENEKN